MKHSFLLTTAVGVVLAALAFAAVEMPRAAAQTQSACSKLISERNLAWDADHRALATISSIRQELADARSPNSGNLDKKVADSQSAVQKLRQGIAALEAASQIDEIPFLLRIVKSELPHAEARLEFWRAKRTQALAGELATIAIPTAYVKDLEARLAMLNREHAKSVALLAGLDRKIAACRAGGQETPSPEPSPCIHFEPTAFRATVASAVFADLPCAPAGASPDWSGTYSNGSGTTATLTSSGTTLSGSSTWTPAGGDHGTQGSDEQWSCTVDGNVATCNVNGSYHDQDKTIAFTARSTLTFGNGSFSVQERILTGNPQWSHGDLGYTPAIHPGAEFSSQFTRQ